MNFGEIQISMQYRKGVLDLGMAYPFQLVALVRKGIIDEADRKDVEEKIKSGVPAPQIPIIFYTVFQYADGSMADGIDAGVMAVVEILRGPAKGRLVEVGVELVKLNEVEEDNDSDSNS